MFLPAQTTVVVVFVANIASFLYLWANFGSLLSSIPPKAPSSRRYLVDKS